MGWEEVWLLVKANLLLSEWYVLELLLLDSSIIKNSQEIHDEKFDRYNREWQNRAVKILSDSKLNDTF